MTMTTMMEMIVGARGTNEKLSLDLFERERGLES